MSIMDHPIPMQPDEGWLARQARNDARAFAEIYESYFDRIYSYVRYQVHDDATADDLTALVFERSMLAMNRYNPRKGDFISWLFGIARNAVREHRRRGHSREIVSLELVGEQPDINRWTEDVIARQEENNHLLAAVTRLKAREREIIALKFGAGLTNRHIAGLVGLSESNVGTILYRSLRRLREMLDREGLYE
jgi:RNA polymerase sigma factor (sigma-70 family)